MWKVMYILPHSGLIIQHIFKNGCTIMANNKVNTLPDSGCIPFAQNKLLVNDFVVDCIGIENDAHLIRVIEEH